MPRYLVQRPFPEHRLPPVTEGSAEAAAPSSRRTLISA